jgi:hypothetical protein
MGEGYRFETQSHARHAMPPTRIAINRAPVLTLWAAVVAERLGFSADESLTLRKAVAALNAQAKGRRLGIFKPHETAAKQAREKSHDEELWIEICARPVPAKNTPQGIRAVHGAALIDPQGVEQYLQQKFGENLGPVRLAMKGLAKSYDRQTLADVAYSLYERFRPEIPAGKKGWGAKGELDLGLIQRLGK